MSSMARIFPSYLVHLNGQIGQTRQSFYADVLEDGRIVRG